MNNVDKFLERLKGFKVRGSSCAPGDSDAPGSHLRLPGRRERKEEQVLSHTTALPRPSRARTQAIIDEGKVQKKTVDATRIYLEMPHFNRDIIYNKSRAAAGLCDWAINIVKCARRPLPAPPALNERVPAARRTLPQSPNPPGPLVVRRNAGTLTW